MTHTELTQSQNTKAAAIFGELPLTGHAGRGRVEPNVSTYNIKIYIINKYILFINIYNIRHVYLPICKIICKYSFMLSINLILPPKKYQH